MWDNIFGAWLYSFENESWIVVSQEKKNVDFFSDLSRPSICSKSKTAHFYLQPLFNALNMLSSLRLTYLTCCVGKWVTESTGTGSPDDVKNTRTHIFSQQNYLLELLWLISSFLKFHFDEVSICSLFNALFIRCFKLICTARVIDCKHRPQWRHQQILHSTVPYGRGIWEKESIIGVQWFQKNPNPRVQRSVGNTASLVSHWNDGPSGWDFFCPHWTPMMDSIYLVTSVLQTRFSRGIKKFLHTG